MNDTGTWHLAIHGGAGQLTPDRLNHAQQAAATQALARALDAGAAVLSAGGGALDAVAAAIRVLEDDPAFNAGRGAVLTHDGRIELDAAIMDGRDRRAGAVAQLTTTRHPVDAARRVMEATPHVMLAGPGADAFARAEGLEQVDPVWFITPERSRALTEMLAREAAGQSSFDAEMKYGTVGAVARDTNGHLAAATSTGGITGKRWGRVGDSPLIGAGTWADDRSCAVSATGSGEMFIRAAAAHDIAARIRLAGEDAVTAARTVLADVGSLGGTGGVIVMPRVGEPLWAFNSAGMFRARIASDGRRTIAMFAEPVH